LVNVTLPPKLQKELEELGKDHQVGALEEGDCINLIFAQFPLGPGFSAASSDLLIRIPRSYPDAGPDMFWVQESVLRIEARIMPTYEFLCTACKKTVSTTLTLAEYEKGKIVCPKCGGRKLNQRETAFYAVTSKKSA
jgi:putative FmdB family regulatory protein